MGKPGRELSNAVAVAAATIIDSPGKEASLSVYRAPSNQTTLPGRLNTDSPIVYHNIYIVWEYNDRWNRTQRLFGTGTQMRCLETSMM